MREYEEEFILHLVRSGAIRFGEFQLKHGSLSPYFINIASAINSGRNATETSKAYVELIIKIGTDFDFIYGPAYKGIPLSALIATRLWETYHIDKRWGYDRKERKTYGDEHERTIVGDLRDGDTVLIVDDVITTGKTKMDGWKILSSEKDIKLKGILIAVDREEGDPGLPVYSILKIRQIFDYLVDREIDGRIYVDKEKKMNFDIYFDKYGLA